MSKFTAGSWNIESDGTTVTMGGQCTIVSPAPDGASNAECRANAKLIAAAPELYAALEAYIRAIDDGGVSHADLFAAAESKARAILAKVR